MKDRICIENLDYPLTEQEKTNLIKALETIEAQFYLPLKNINGGFASAELYDNDDKFFFVEVAFGTEEVTNYEELKISRDNFLVI